MACFSAKYHRQCARANYTVIYTNQSYRWIIFPFAHDPITALEGRRILAQGGAQRNPGWG
jgi:hypothetical protein